MSAVQNLIEPSRRYKSVQLRCQPTLVYRNILPPRTHPMGLLPRMLVALASGSFLLPSIAALTFGFPYGSQTVRGVNLGGWLVLEV